MIHCAVAASVLYVIFGKNYSVFNAVTLSCKLYTSILNIVFYTGLAQLKSTIHICILNWKSIGW